MDNAISKKQSRNSAIELLRIIAMLMIIFHHFVNHGELSYGVGNVTIPQLWCNLIYAGGKIGSNVFVLISGYFLINDKFYGFNWNRIAKFWGQVFFYSVGIALVFKVVGIGDVGIKTLIKSVLPISMTQWWFATTYFVLYLLHPFINKLLHSMNKKEHQLLVVSLVIFWSVIPTVLPSMYECNNLLWFILLYCFAAYIKLYGLNPKLQSKHYFALWIVITLLTYSSTVVFGILGARIGALASRVFYFCRQEMLTSLLSSLALFMAFATMKMNYHKWINVVASATFGVYLIHDNKLVSKFLWIDLLKCASYQDSNIIILYSIGAVLGVFVICALIDLARQMTVEKIYLSIVNKYMDKLIKPFQAVLDWVKGIVFGK